MIVDVERTFLVPVTQHTEIVVPDELSDNPKEIEKYIRHQKVLFSSELEIGDYNNELFSNQDEEFDWNIRPN